MTPEIVIRLSPAAERLLSTAVNTDVLKAMARTLDQENERTVSETILKRLSFPRTGPATLEGLRVQTGRLRRSLRRTKARVEGTTVTSSIGSNVRYFGVHEFGFQGSVNVAAHTRQRFNVMKLLGRQRELPVFKPTETTRRRGESDEAFFARSNAREQFARRAFEQKLQRVQYENSISFRTVKARGRDSFVRSHNRRLSIPERAMLRRTLAERGPAYTEALSNAVRTVLGGGQ